MSSDSRKPMDDSATGQGKVTFINLGSSSAALPTAAGGHLSSNTQHSNASYRGAVKRSYGDDGSQRRTPAFHGELNQSGKEDRESDVSQHSTTNFRGGTFRQDRQSDVSKHSTSAFRGGVKRSYGDDGSQNRTPAFHGEFSRSGREDRESEVSQRSTSNYRGGTVQQNRQSDASQHSNASYRGAVKRSYGDDGPHQSTPAFHGEFNRSSREDRESDVSQRSISNYRGGTVQQNRQSDASQHSNASYRGGSVQPSSRGAGVTLWTFSDVHRSQEPPQARPPADQVQKSMVLPAVTMPPPKVPSFLRGQIRAVSYVESPIEKEHVKRVVSRYVRAKDSSLFAASQPVQIEMADGEGCYKQLSDRRYYVTWKAEGERCLVLIEDKGRVWLVDSASNVFSLKQLTFPKKRDEHIKNTLIEAEVVIDKLEGGKEVPRMLITDIIRLEDKDQGDMPLLKRIQTVKDRLIGPRTTLKRDNECMGVRCKEWYAMDAARKIMVPEFRQKVPHRIEGLLFKARDEPYTSGHLLEWNFPKASDLDDAQKKRITWEQLDAYISTLPPEKRTN